MTNDALLKYQLLQPNTIDSIKDKRGDGKIAECNNWRDHSSDFLKA